MIIVGNICAIIGMIFYGYRIVTRDTRHLFLDWDEKYNDITWDGVLCLCVTVVNFGVGNWILAFLWAILACVSFAQR